MKLKWIVLLLALFAGAVVFAADTAAGTNAPAGKTMYTCGMHPWIIQDHPGNCPICGMKLEPVRKQAPSTVAGRGKILYYKSTMNPGETSPTPA